MSIKSNNNQIKQSLASILNDPVNRSVTQVSLLADGCARLTFNRAGSLMVAICQVVQRIKDKDLHAKVNDLVNEAITTGNLPSESRLSAVYCELISKVD